MEWWQIVLVLLLVGVLSVICGMTVGIPLSKRVLRWRNQTSVGKYRIFPVKEATQMVERSGSAETPTVEEKGRKPVARMVPLFSWRTIIAVAIGFIVGAGLGLVFWIISPSLTSSSGQAEPDGFQQTMGRNSGSWQSEVTIQVVNPGSEVMSLNAMANRAQYYAAKANSMPFLEFLRQELAEQSPEYSYTVDELDGMVNIAHEAYKEPPAIEVSAIAPTAEEAVFFTSHIPGVFKKYLVVEELNKRQWEYENTLTAIENVKAAILQAENERISPSRESANRISNNPDYVALNAQVEALESELRRLAGELSTSIVSGDNAEANDRRQQEYEEILQKAQEKSLDRSKAMQKLRDMENKWSIENDIQNTQSHIELKSKIKALELQLDIKMTEIAVLIGQGESDAAIETVQEDIERLGSAIVVNREELANIESQWSGEGLTENLNYQLAQADIANLDIEIYALRERLVSLVNESALEEYEQDIQASFKKTSAALAEARNELANLENQWIGESLAENLDYQIAQTRVDNLNRELELLNDRLSSILVSNGDASEEIDFLAVGNPSMPAPVFPMRLRTALMLGIVVGVGGAWVVLNFRWLTKIGASSPEDEEDEA